MNVAANIGIFGNADTFLQGLVGKRKGGVQSHHSRNLTIALANFLDETSIFSNSTARNEPASFPRS